MVDIIVGWLILLFTGMVLILIGMTIMVWSVGEWMDWLGVIIATAGAVVLVYLLIITTVLVLYAGVGFIQRGVGM